MARPEPDPVYVLRAKDHITGLLSYSNNILLSGNAVGTITIWNIKNMRTEDSINAHETKPVLCLGSLKDSKHFISQGRNGTIILWKLEGFSVVKMCETESSSLGFCKCDLYTSSDKVNIAIPSSSSQSEVIVLEIKDNKFLSSEDKIVISANKDHGMTMCFKFVDKQHLLVGYENGEVVMWNLTNQTQLSKVKVHEEPIMCLDFECETGKGFSGSATDEIAYWKVNQKRLELITRTKITNPGLNDIAIRKDKKIIATAGWDGKIRIFSFKKFSPLAVLSFHCASIQCLTFSQLGMLIAGSKDGQITFWNLYNSN